MKILYHCLYQVIDFLFPHQVEDYDVSAFQENNEKLGKNITALFSYQDEKVKEAVWQIKYYRNEKVAQDIAKKIYEKIILLKLPTPYVLVPIPMSNTSRRQRGYNQTEFIAEKLVNLLENGGCSGISFDLQKIHTSRPQHTLERAKRIENATKMFFVREKNCFFDKNVLVIDDVVTTGSTLREAMWIILENGAKHVCSVAVAH